MKHSFLLFVLAIVGQSQIIRSINVLQWIQDFYPVAAQMLLLFIPAVGTFWASNGFDDDRNEISIFHAHIEWSDVLVI